MNSDGRSVLVTVGLPVYNGERFIEQAIQSTLAQTYKNLELVISDNASTDGTETICRKWMERDPRVRYIRNPVNRGQAWNYGRLLEFSRGKYFKWVAADDSCSPDFLAKCVEVLENNISVVLACTRTVFIDEQGQPLKQIDPGWDLRSEAADKRLATVILKSGHWANADALSGVIRTEALKRIRLIPPYQGGDKRPLAELSLLGKFAEIPEYLLFRRLHNDASTANNPGFRNYDSKTVRWMMEFNKVGMWYVYLPTWNLMLDHLVTIWRSGLGGKAMIKLIYIVLKAGWWQRHFFIQEAAAVTRARVDAILHGNR